MKRACTPDSDDSDLIVNAYKRGKRSRTAPSKEDADNENIISGDVNYVNKLSPRINDDCKIDESKVTPIEEDQLEATSDDDIKSTNTDPVSLDSCIVVNGDQFEVHSVDEVSSNEDNDKESVKSGNENGESTDSEGSGNTSSQNSSDDDDGSDYGWRCSFRFCNVCGEYHL